jgi:hypothetical protein
MGLATYAIIATGKTWAVLHDGNVEGDFITKESAFESAVAAASLAIREGHMRSTYLHRAGTKATRLH